MAKDLPESKYDSICNEFARLSLDWICEQARERFCLLPILRSSACERLSAMLLPLDGSTRAELLYERYSQQFDALHCSASEQRPAEFWSRFDTVGWKIGAVSPWYPQPVRMKSLVARGLMKVTNGIRSELIEIIAHEQFETGFQEDPVIVAEEIVAIAGRPLLAKRELWKAFAASLERYPGFTARRSLGPLRAVLRSGSVEAHTTFVFGSNGDHRQVTATVTLARENNEVFALPLFHLCLRRDFFFVMDLFATTQEVSPAVDAFMDVNRALLQDAAAQAQ